MDTFMDKLASRLNAQEMIRANSAAEARESEKLKQEVDAYRECLQELREICLENSGTKDEVSELVKMSIDKISAIQEGNNTEEILRAIRSGNDAVTSKVRTLNEELKQYLSEELLPLVQKELKGQEESVHRECVKVYRNVQAVVTQENDKQTKLFEENMEKMRKKSTAVLVCGILAMSFAALGLMVSVFDMLGVFSWVF